MAQQTDQQPDVVELVIVVEREADDRHRAIVWGVEHAAAYGRSRAGAVRKALEIAAREWRS